MVILLYNKFIWINHVNYFQFLTKYCPFSRSDINLCAFLDYEIWKASYLLTEDFPGSQHVFDNDDDELIDFKTGVDPVHDKGDELLSFHNEIELNRNSLYDIVI